MRCRMCAGDAPPFATGLVLSRYTVQYYRCGQCGFIGTQAPFWLPEAYSEAITGTDVGLASRNLVHAAITAALITCLFPRSGKFLDYGGGYGLLVRLMRDRGFDFYRYDPQCANLFAQGYDVDIGADTGARYELLTAFEVFEHLPEPMETIDHMLRLSGSIFFATELVPAGPPRPGEWAYYGLEHGQHISLYSLQTLEWIARQRRLRLYTNGASLHLLSARRIPRPVFRWIARHKIAGLINLLSPRRSLLPSDHARALQAQRSRQPASDAAPAEPRP